MYMVKVGGHKMVFRLGYFIIFLFFMSPVFAKQSNEKYPLGMNLNGVSDWSTEMPFLNLVKQSRSWISQRRGSSWGKGGSLDLDENGWVRALRVGQSADLIFLTVNQPLVFRRYVVLYKGEGIIRYSGAARKVKRLGKGRDLISVSERGNRYAILSLKSTNPENYVRDIAIVPEEYLGEYLAGEKFNPIWLDYISNFYALRFMDWMKTNNSQEENWKNRPRVTDRSWASKGVPLEVMIELANRTKSGAWFNMPHKADLAYIRRFAELTKQFLRPEIRIYVEHSNEVWNWSFQQAHYAKAEGKRLWGQEGNHFMQWHGMRSAKICDVWKSVFAGDEDRVICVLAVHPGWRGLEKAAIECPSWVKEGNNRCVDHDIDALAITGYFTGCLDGNAGWKQPSRIRDIRSWFSDADGGMKKAFLQTKREAYFPCTRSLTSLQEIYTYFANVAKKYNLQLYAYEGGQHISVNGTQVQGDDSFVRFHLNFNRSDYMYKLTMNNFENWKASGGALFMYYNDLFPPSKWGSWGSMDHLLDTDSPKARAIHEFSAGKDCWWTEC